MGRTQCQCVTPGDADADDIGYPVGMIQGTIKSQQASKTLASNNLLALQYCYVAFGTTYLKSIVKWTACTIDEIWDKANKLYVDAIQGVSADVLDESNLAMKFEFRKYAMQVLRLDESVSGVVASSDADIKNVYRGLRSFFGRSKAGIFTGRNTYFLIWRDRIAYYVIDTQGRLADGSVDTKYGHLTMFCFESVKNFAYFLANTSALNAYDTFSIAELKMKQLIKKTDVPLDSLERAKKNRWRALGSNRAILRGSIHTDCNCFRGVQWEMGIAACIMAGIYSRISRPNSWNGRIVDKILLLGFAYLQECARKNENVDFSLKTLVKEYDFGRHTVQIRIKQTIGQGKLLYTIDNNQNELALALNQLYYEGYKFLLICIYKHTFIVWRSEGMYYLFDPHKRNGNGEISDKTSARASILMHSTLDSLTQYFIETLMKNYAKETFIIHCLRVTICSKKLDKLAKEAGEDASLVVNESIDDVYLPKISCAPADLSVTDMISQDGSDDMFASGDGTSTTSTLIDEDDEPNNIFDIPNDIFDKLRHLNISESQIFAFYNMGMSINEIEKWAKLNLTADQVALLKSFGLSSCEYEALIKHGFDFVDVKTMHELDLTPKKYMKMKKQGIRPEDMQRASITDENMKKFKKFDLNLSDIEKLLDLGLTPEDYEQYRSKGLRYDDIVYITEHRISADAFIKMKRGNYSTSDIDQIVGAGFDPDEYLRVKQLGLDSDEMLFCKENRIDAELFRYLKKKCFTLDEIIDLRDIPITQEQVEYLLKQGFTLADIKRAYQNGISIEELMEWAEAAPITIDKILALKEQNITPDDYKKQNKKVGIDEKDVEKLLEMGLTPEQIEALRKFAISGNDVQNLLEAGYTADEIARALEAGFTVKDLLLAKELGLSLEELEELKRLGISLEDYIRMKEMGLSLDQMKELIKLGIDPHDALKLIENGLSFDELEQALVSGTKPEELLKAVGIIGDSKGLDIDDELRRKLLELGYTEDEIKAMLNSGIDLNEIASQGVNRDVFNRLKRLQITPEEYEQLLSLGYTLDDIEREAELLGITPRELALGLLMGLTLDEMKILKDLSVTPEQYLQMLKSGLSFNDIKNAVMCGIKPEELAAWAAIGGLTLDQILDLRIRKMTPDQYKRRLQSREENKKNKKGKKPDSSKPSAAVTPENEKPCEPCTPCGICKPCTPRVVDPCQMLPVQVKQNLAVVSSSTGTPLSLQKLLATSFQIADRVLVLTGWGDYVCFRSPTKYFLYSGCSCNLDGIRRLDINQEHKYLVPYNTVDQLINALLQQREVVERYRNRRFSAADSASVKSVISSNDSRVRRNSRAMQLRDGDSPRPCKCNKPQQTTGNEVEEIEKMRFAKALIGKKLEHINRETQRILNNFRAIKQHF